MNVENISFVDPWKQGRPQSADDYGCREKYDTRDAT